MSRGLDALTCPAAHIVKITSVALGEERLILVRQAETGAAGGTSSYDAEVIADALIDAGIDSVSQQRFLVP